MSRNYADVHAAVARTRTLVTTATLLDDAEMYLVLRSEVLLQMTCSYRAALAAATARRDQLVTQLERDLGRVVDVLAVLERSRDVPRRLSEASADWTTAGRDVTGLEDRIVLLERNRTDWTGRARQQQAAAVERQRAATEELATAMRHLADVTAQGGRLMESVFTMAHVTVGGCNTRLAGFVGRAPSSHVGLWGMFSRTSAAIPHVRAAATSLAQLVSPSAPWRAASRQLQQRAAAVGGGNLALPAAGWPRPVAGQA